MTKDFGHDDLKLLCTNLEWVGRQFALVGESFIGLNEAMGITSERSVDLERVSSVLDGHTIMRVGPDTAVRLWNDDPTSHRDARVNGTVVNLGPAEIRQICLKSGE